MDHRRASHVRGPRGRHIRGRPVPPVFPARGPVDVLLVGEAPGPRGADRTGIPFWGDRAGILVYRVLMRAGMADVPEDAWTRWNGTSLARRGLRPRLRRAAITNAIPFCPTRDGERFRAPRRSQLLDRRNLARLRREIERASRRCPETLHVIALGRSAAIALEALQGNAPSFALDQLGHPSPLALAAGRAGTSMAVREQSWQEELGRLLSARLISPSDRCPSRPPGPRCAPPSLS